MPTVRLNAGPVTVAYSAEVVGPPPQWADDSDATYAHGWRDQTTGAIMPSLWATVDPLPPGAESVSRITLHVRARVDNEGAVHPGLRSFFVTFDEHPSAAAFVEPGDSGEGQVYLPSPGAVYDHTASDIKTAFGQVVEPNDLLDLLRDGARIWASRGSTGNFDEVWRYSLTVYELWLEVDYEGVGTTLPPLRQFPRDDQLGSAARVWPTSSQQGSLRRHGYY